MTTAKTMRKRFWVETGLTAASLVLLVATLINQEWIEAVFGVDPDNGNGTLEWAIVVAVALAAATSAVLARAEWRRTAYAAN